MGIFLLVGAQTSWVLRPYLGTPGKHEITLFTREREGGLVYQLLGQRRARRRPDVPRRAPVNVRDLLVLYGVAGLACAVAVLGSELARGTAAAVWSAIATIPLWPLWAPFVLATPRPKPRPSPSSSRENGTDAANPARRDATRDASGDPGSSDASRGRAGPLARIEDALDESVKAVAGTPMSAVFSRQVAQRIAAEVAVVAERIDELAALASCRGLDRAASAARLQELEARGAAERTIATARLQHESLLRLEQLRAADVQALDELADLLEALRAQLLLARYAGSSAEGTSAIVSEVWARLEGLGAAFEAPRA